VVERDLRASRDRRYATLSHLIDDKAVAKMGHPDWWRDEKQILRCAQNDSSKKIIQNDNSKIIQDDSNDATNF
jgi:hypothetical protein